MRLTLVCRVLHTLVVTLAAVASIGTAFADVPVVTKQPGVVAATGGTAATLTVEATGTGPLTYQWRRIGVPIEGATGSSFTIVSFSPMDAGAYDVVVADGPSSTTSQPGWLNYRAPAGLLWGTGYAPALGIGVSGRRDAPRVMADDVVQVAAGYSQSFFIKSDGTLWATGANGLGGLGDGTRLSRAVPVQVANGVAQVAAGFGHTLILKRDSTLWAVGSNSMGQLGNNTNTDSLNPIQVAGGVVQIAAGYQHSAFLKSDGSLWVFGGNTARQLGDGSNPMRLTPLFVTSGVKQVAAGAFSTVFVKTDGSLWGMGDYGYTVPTQLDTGVDSVAAASIRLFFVKTNGSLWYRGGTTSYASSVQVDTGVATVAVSGWGSAASYLKTDATMWVYGSAGIASTPTGPGVQIASDVARIAAGSEHFLFVKSDDTLWSSGAFSEGQLGDGASTKQVSPAYVSDAVVGTATGGNHSFLLKADGTLWGAGLNTSGQLGDGTTLFRSSPALTASAVRSVVAGSSHSLFIKNDATLWTTGSNNYGQVGDGTTGNRSVPISVASDVVVAAAGGSHSLFLKTDATVWAMGLNTSGQLGDGTTTNRSLPVSVATGVIALAAGDGHSLLLKSDGTLWAMGMNTFGQLGDGTTINRSTPVQVTTGVIAVSAGYGHSLFLKTDGTLWGMGVNGSGQLGDGSVTARSTPVQMATNVVAMAAGRESSVFLKNDGTLWGTGANSGGQLGDGTTTSRSTPAQIGAGVTAMAAGGSATLFIQQPGFGAAPTISTQPQPITVGRGATSLLTVGVAGGTPVDYQWFKNGVALVGARSAQLSLVFTTAADEGNYTVVVTNAAGTATSSAATITVSPPPALTSAPASTTIVAGGTATFTVAATGAGTLHYQWFRNDAPLTGETGATLTFTNVQLGDVGYYSVLVTDDYDSTLSSEVALNLPSFPIAAAALDQLALGAAFDGTNYMVAIQGDASNGTASTVQLVAPNGALVGSRISLGRNGGEAGVGMGGIKAAFDGTNYLVVWADNAATPEMRLYGAFISPAGALVGSVFAFPVDPGASTIQRPQGIAFNGSRYLVVYSDGVSKPWKLCGRFVTPAGVVGNEIILAANTVDSFQSVASNGNNFLVAWPARLAASQNVIQGRTVSDTGALSGVIAIDSDISPSYNPVGVASDGTDYLVSWNFDTGPGYPSPTSWELRSRIVTATGTLPAPMAVLCSNATNPVFPAIAFDGGNYLVAWTQFTLGGNYENINNTPEDLGHAVGMDVAARYLDRTGVPRGAAFTLVAGSGNQGLTPVAAGNGNCLVVYNELEAPFGSSSNNTVRGVLLADSVPPVISAQPVSQNVALGATATFTVNATGPDLTYQWIKDGVIIPGARTATLTLTNVQTTSFGSYSVVVANGGCSVTSVPVILGVNNVGGPRYRLLDYTAPMVVGNEWLYDGPGYDSTQTHTRRRIENLDYPITCYTGRGTPQAYQQSTVSNRSAYGYLTGSTFHETDVWYDYFHANGVSFGFNGYDDDPGTLEGRTDEPLLFPESMAVGESNVATKDYYLNGVWTGPMGYSIRLLGVETVTVPAGTFVNCLHIRYVLAGQGPDQLNDEWLALGIGTVKHRDMDPGEPVYDRNLISYTVQPPVLPTVSVQPADTTFSSGSSATLSVTATGTAPFFYQWYQGDTGDTSQPVIGAVTANLTTPTAARYWVRIANRSAVVNSAAATVTMTMLPSFVTQPGSQIVNAGFSATFTVLGSGLPAPTYQWQKNGVNIDGATGTTYTIASVAAGDVANYTVIATNSVGSTTSDTATLTLGIIPAGFDVVAYLARYPDIAALYGTNYDAAWLYYRDHGIYQGEVYDELFRVEEYLALYPELFAVFGNNFSGALVHWLAEGSIEGRLGRIPLEFSATGYLTRNPDVAAAVGNNPILAWGHYWLYGIYEGRAYDDELNVFEYLAINADLTAAFVNDWRQAALHWMRYGRTEGRLGRLPVIFSSGEYIARYPEVGAVWGTYPTTVFLHYWIYGIDEGRNFDDLFRPVEYLALNSDLAAVFGTDRRGAFKHWVRYGQSEGRSGKYP